MPAGRAPLTRPRIIAAARDLIDAEGLASLSMRKLGAALGVEAMSLYNHVRNKEDVLDGVLESLLVEVPLPDPALPWNDRLRQLAHSLRAVATAHPAMIPLFSTRQVTGQQAWAPLLCAFEILRQEGFDPAEALEAILAATSYVLGFVVTELGALAEVARDSEVDWKSLDARERWLLAELGEALVTGDPDRQFVSGLDLLMAGLERRASAR
jgi:TetR/AcrR family transcriptional regulator, tetracycline repressor protein